MGIIEIIFLNKIMHGSCTQWNCIQQSCAQRSCTKTQIFIPLILFLAEKRWLKKGIMEMKVWTQLEIAKSCSRSLYFTLLQTLICMLMCVNLQIQMSFTLLLNLVFLSIILEMATLVGSLITDVASGKYLSLYPLVLCHQIIWTYMNYNFPW